MKMDSSVPQSIPGKANATHDIEAVLRGARPFLEAPADLREDIMRQVRLENRRLAQPHPKQSFPAWRWAVVPAAAAVMLLALVVSRDADLGNRVPDAGSLHAASQVLASEDRLAGDLTAAIVSPLHVEMTRLDSDLKRVANHLLASVP